MIFRAGRHLPYLSFVDSLFFLAIRTLVVLKADSVFTESKCDCDLKHHKTLSVIASNALHIHTNTPSAILQAIYFSDCTSNRSVCWCGFGASTSENWFQLSRSRGESRFGQILFLFHFICNRIKEINHSQRPRTKNKSSKHQFNVSIFIHRFRLCSECESCYFFSLISFATLLFLHPFAFVSCVFVCLMPDVTAIV